MSVGRIIKTFREYRGVEPVNIANDLAMSLEEYLKLETSEDTKLTNDRKKVLAERLGIPNKVLDLMTYSTDIKHPVFIKLVKKWQKEFADMVIADIKNLESLVERTS